MVFNNLGVDIVAMRSVGFDNVDLRVAAELGNRHVVYPVLFIKTIA